MLFGKLAETSQRVAEDRGRLKKIGYLAECLRQLSADEVEAGIAFLAGDMRQGRIGLGYAAVRDAMPERPADAATLTVSEVDATFDRIATMGGSGSVKEKVQAFADLLQRAESTEQEFLARLVCGELRQGAQEGVMIEAVAKSADVAAGSVRRAVMLAGDVVKAAAAALSRGEEGLAGFRLQLLTPVKPMLVQTAEDVPDVFRRYEEIGLEYKFDGARIQVHRLGDEVRVFTRKLSDVSAAVPEVVEAVRSLPVSRLILDGETIVMGDDGTPAPFQTTMRRFGRRLNIEEMRSTLPLSSFFFDCLHIDGEDLIDRPGAERSAAMRQLLPADDIVPGVVTSSLAEAQTFVDEALKAGHEGVMAKALDGPYEAGRRGAGWLKLKPSHTLDLVVLAVEWGSGRRQGWLSNLHIGARDSAGGFVMLGKTFKGMTDEMLEWQTKKLLELEVAREGHTVHVRPELVVEVAFDGVQQSSRYPGGMALRFARVKRYRPDKRVEDADTVEAVRAILGRSAKKDSGVDARSAPEFR